MSPKALRLLSFLMRPGFPRRPESGNTGFWVWDLRLGFRVWGLGFTISRGVVPGKSETKFTCANLEDLVPYSIVV